MSSARRVIARGQGRARDRTPDVGNAVLRRDDIRQRRARFAVRAGAHAPIRRLRPRCLRRQILATAVDPSGPNRTHRRGRGGAPFALCKRSRSASRQQGENGHCSSISGGSRRKPGPPPPHSHRAAEPQSARHYYYAASLDLLATTFTLASLVASSCVGPPPYRRRCRARGGYVSKESAAIVLPALPLVVIETAPSSTSKRRRQTRVAPHAVLAALVIVVRFRMLEDERAAA